MDCGRPAMRDLTWTEPRARWMSTGEPDRGPHALEQAISRALGRPWTHGEPRPTFERLTHTGFCVECDAKGRERRRRQRAGREEVPGRRIRSSIPTYHGRPLDGR